MRQREGLGHEVNFELPPGCAALAALGARRASFSKYASCFAALAR